jgi:hypothetical protein
LRGLVGQELYAKQDVRFMPYVGLAVRYLNDGFDEVPATPTTWSGYERESQYIYIPIGLKAEKITPEWSVAATLEVDILIDGTQTTHLEDVQDFAGVNQNLDPIETEQEDGYGIRTSLKFVKYGEKVHWVFEPFFRWWDIEKSNTATITQNGSPYSPPGSELFYLGFEPDNETWEAGARVGIQF